MALSTLPLEFLDTLYPEYTLDTLPWSLDSDHFDQTEWLNIRICDTPLHVLDLLYPDLNLDTLPFSLDSCDTHSVYLGVTVAEETTGGGGSKYEERLREAVRREAERQYRRRARQSKPGQQEKQVRRKPIGRILLERPEIVDLTPIELPDWKRFTDLDYLKWSRRLWRDYQLALDERARLTALAEYAALIEARRKEKDAEIVILLAA